MNCCIYVHTGVQEEYKYIFNCSVTAYLHLTNLSTLSSELLGFTIRPREKSRPEGTKLDRGPTKLNSSSLLHGLRYEYLVWVHV